MKIVLSSLIGCCWRKHLTYDDPEDITQLRPGMHANYEAEKKIEQTNKAFHMLKINENVKNK